MRITTHSNKWDMAGLPLALDAERSPLLELLVIENLKCSRVPLSLIVIHFSNDRHNPLK